jgi:hypothetical protein
MDMACVVLLLVVVPRVVVADFLSEVSLAFWADEVVVALLFLESDLEALEEEVEVGLADEVELEDEEVEELVSVLPLSSPRKGALLLHL